MSSLVRLLVDNALSRISFIDAATLEELNQALIAFDGADIDGNVITPEPGPVIPPFPTPLDTDPIDTAEKYPTEPKSERKPDHA